MIHAYKITFPQADPGVDPPKVETEAHTKWDQSCWVYRFDEATRAFTFHASVGGPNAPSTATLPTDAMGRTFLFRLVNRMKAGRSTFPWRSSNNVLMDHGAKLTYLPPDQRGDAKAARIVGDDGNAADFSDMVMVISYESPEAAEIDAVMGDLGQGLHEPPAEISSETWEAEAD